MSDYKPPSAGGFGPIKQLETRAVETMLSCANPEQATELGWPTVALAVADPKDVTEALHRADREVRLRMRYVLGLIISTSPRDLRQVWRQAAEWHRLSPVEKETQNAASEEFERRTGISEWGTEYQDGIDAFRLLKVSRNRHAGLLSRARGPLLLVAGLVATDELASLAYDAVDPGSISKSVAVGIAKVAVLVGGINLNHAILESRLVGIPAQRAARIAVAQAGVMINYHDSRQESAPE